jgi:hypothetical protein
MMGQTSSRAPWWAQFVVLIGAVLLAAGAVIALVRPAMLVGPQARIDVASHVFAGYFAARNLALAFALIVLFILRARRALSQLLALVSLVQLFDAAMDCIEGRWAVAPGVLVLGILFLLAASRLCGHPFWRREAWVE